MELCSQALHDIVCSRIAPAARPPSRLFRWAPLRCRRVNRCRSSQPAILVRCSSGATIRSYHRSPAGFVVKQTARSPSTGTTRSDKTWILPGGLCCTHE